VGLSGAGAEVRQAGQPVELPRDHRRAVLATAVIATVAAWITHRSQESLSQLRQAWLRGIFLPPAA